MGEIYPIYAITGIIYVRHFICARYILRYLEACARVFVSAIEKHSIGRNSRFLWKNHAILNDIESNLLRALFQLNLLLNRCIVFLQLGTPKLSY